MPPKSRKPLAQLIPDSPAKESEEMKKATKRKVQVEDTDDVAEEVIPDDWPSLLEKALSVVKGQKTFTKTLCSNAEDVIEVCKVDDLRKALWTASFVAIPEGRKFCSKIFKKIGVRSAFFLMKNSIVAGATKVTCTHYGEIILAAWKAAAKEEDFLAEIETEMITGMAHGAIFLSDPYSAKFSAMLSAFGEMSRTRAKMDDMLYKCFLPVLWRGLKANHDKVRYRASIVLLDFYPIVCEDGDDRAAILDKQHESLGNMLTDDCSAIRQEAASKILKICANFWSFLPVYHRKEYLSLILDKLSCDSEIAVRLAVLQGLRHMLPVPVCLTVTENALKIVCPLRINDKNDRVRLETFDLLRRLKGHRYLKFFDVVNIDDLMARFEVETSESVRKEIVHVIFRSFFPSDCDQNEKLRRFQKLAKFGRNCTLNFHRLIFPLGLITVKEAVEHVQYLSICAYRLSKHDVDQTLSADTSKLSLDETDGTLSGFSEDGIIPDEKDPKWNCAKLLLESVAILFMMIRDKLNDPEYDKERTKMELLLTKVFKRMFARYRDTSALGTTMIIGSLLPQQHLSREGISSTVLKLLNENIDGAVIEPYLEAIVHWDISVLFKIISDGLNVLSESDGTRSPVPKRSKSSQPQLTPNERFAKALQYLKYIISSTGTSQLIIQQHQFELEEFFKQLQFVRNCIEARLGDGHSPSISDNLLIDAFSMKQTLAVLILNGPKKPSDESLLLFVRELCVDADWFERDICQCPEDDSKRDFWYIFCESVLQKIGNILMAWDFTSVPTVSKAPTFLRPRGDDSDAIDQEPLILDFVTSVTNIVANFCSGSTPLELFPHVLLASKQLLTVAPASQKTVMDIMDYAPVWILKRIIEGEDLDEKLIADALFNALKVVMDHPLFDLDKYMYKVADICIGYMSALVGEEHEVADPRMHDYEIPSLISVLIFKVVKKNAKMLKSFRMQLGAHFVSSQLLGHDDCENLNEKWIEILGACLQLAYLLDLDADGNSRDKQSESKRKNEERSAMIRELAMKITQVEATAEEDSIDSFLLTQIKALL